VPGVDRLRASGHRVEVESTLRASRYAATISAAIACAFLFVGASAAAARTGRTRGVDPTGHRVRSGTVVRSLPNPLYGVTVDTVTSLTPIVQGAQSLPETPTTRIYFDVREPASYYTAAIDALEPKSYLMGELLDSSDEKRIGTRAWQKRIKSYLSTLGNKIDIWEIGNEVNGNWTGRYRVVATKLADAYDAVSSAGGRSALTLYYNVGCGDGKSELDPLSFSSRYVPPAVRSGLDYVFLSYYEDTCGGIRPSAAAWTAYFAQLHQLYPNALLGFGEVGMDRPVTTSTLAVAQSIMNYYYGLHIGLPYYVGGYFWWYYDEDCLPSTSAPLWPTLTSAFQAEAASLGP
jgi:hypothetical protein